MENNWRNPETKPMKPLYFQERGGGKIAYSDKPKKKRKIKLPKSLFKFLFLSGLILFLMLGIFSIGMLAWISKDLPSADGVLKREVAVSSKIYDRTGEHILYNIHGDIKRTLIPLEQIPEHTKMAVLSAEDRDFYKHRGFSLTGMLRSALKNFFTGSRVGGSTLTQQFVKNAILTNEKTYTRKIKELLISYQIEKKFTKEEILNMYLNEIPYGSVIYGIEAASQSFFGKSVKDLTIAESAIIAAIPNAPTYYSPYGNNKDKLLVRQRYIIDVMAELGHITKDQAETAKSEKISFIPLQENITAPHFVMYIRELLSQKYGETFVAQEGLNVYTSLDVDLQKIAEEAVKSGVEANSAKYDFNNASLVALDTKTGQILAMVGSANYFDNEIDGQVNVALRPRQPGSSFKPIVYTASFIKGYTPNTVVYDTLTNFDTTGAQPYIPQNYNLSQSGPVTLRKALAGSLNIPAVKLTYLTGMKAIFDLSEKLGYTTLADRDRFGLSIVLGGAEVKLLEHVGAYSVFAQEGQRAEISPILKIEDKNGKVIEEYKEKKTEVLDVQVARQINSVLSDDSARSYVFGSGSKLTLPGRPVAAKTGTTNNFHDAWIVGYTPSLVAGVWVGNADNKPMSKGADGSVIAAPIWNQFMKEALKDSAVENFNAPEEVVTGKPILDGELTQEREIKIDTISGKLATEYTPEETIKIIKIKETHNILHYINKDDPRGEAPTNPTADSQYTNWEKGVLDWAVKNDIPVDNQDFVIPTEYDDFHYPEDRPTLRIISPNNNSTLNETTLHLRMEGTAKRGINQTEYYINNQLIETINGFSSEKSLDLSNFGVGNYTLTIKIKDDLKNTASQSLDFSLLRNDNLPSVRIDNPSNNSEVTIPFTISGTLINQDKIKQVDFYYQKIGEGSEQLINPAIINSDRFSLTFNRELDAGDYQLIPYIFSYSGQKYRQSVISIRVE
jgi:1A family penicillin-binding protein